MHKPFDVREQLAVFAGTAPLFPLPNVVHFPHLLLPLHVFETRYREMVADALSGSRMIAMALLSPGWVTTEGSPSIHDVACLGRITADQQLPDGRYDIVLQGLSRARIVAEESAGRPYRTAELELCPDSDSSLPAAAIDAERRILLSAFHRLYAHHDLDTVLRRAIDEEVPLGILCDVLADAMSLDPQTAYRVLAEVDVDRRCRLILRLIHEKLRLRRKAGRTAWPPQFSLN